MSRLVILAGGKGTRMKSDIPKVLHKLNGELLISRILRNTKSVCEHPTIIIGYKGNDVIRAVGDSYDFVWQKEQLGTGHALLCAKETLSKDLNENIIVIPGDHPFVNAETLKKLEKVLSESRAVAALATVRVPSFDGTLSVFEHSGRIVRNVDGNIASIVEYKDASEEERGILEVNISYYCFRSDWLWANIEKIKNNNKSGEYYLTDLIELALSQGEVVASVPVVDPGEGMGVNSTAELNFLENIIIGFGPVKRLDI